MNNEVEVTFSELGYLSWFQIDHRLYQKLEKDSMKKLKVAANAYDFTNGGRLAYIKPSRVVHPTYAPIDQRLVLPREDDNRSLLISPNGTWKYV